MSLPDVMVYYTYEDPQGKMCGSKTKLTHRNANWHLADEQNLRALEHYIHLSHLDRRNIQVMRLETL